MNHSLKCFVKKSALLAKKAQQFSQGGEVATMVLLRARCRKRLVFRRFRRLVSRDVVSFLDYRGGDSNA
jgi:hypothetical protein